MPATAIPCFSFSQKPEPQEVFYAPGTQRTDENDAGCPGNTVKGVDQVGGNFLESLADQFERKGTLSDKQFHTLDNIYTEKTD